MAQEQNKRTRQSKSHLKQKGRQTMTEAERREAELRSIMKLVKSGEKKEEKKAPKKTKGAK